MNINKINSALQDLIIRLQDAEKGFKTIEENTHQIGFKEWMGNLSNERHRQHQLLENEMSKLNGMPEVKTSFLGDMHRMFIDFKMNYIDDNLDSVIEEIERGNSMLLNDFDKVINELTLPITIRDLLLEIKLETKAERNKLTEFKELFMAAEA